jgi:type IV pilus assembly protein PilA
MSTSTSPSRPSPVNDLRSHDENERGFTLIELLIVILIVGILAAIAIPAFLNQQAKGYDAAAKSNLRTAESAMEIYSLDHNGAYPASVNTQSSADPLVVDEPALKNAPWVTGGAASGGYTLTAQAIGPNSAGGDAFTLVVTNGVVTRTCSGTVTGCPSGTW